MSRKNFSHKKLKLTFFCTRLQKHLKIYPKGLDSSNNIDNRMKITTFFNLPDMFRRYLRHLQCYIFRNRRCNKVRYIALAILRAKKFTELVTFSYLQGESQVYVFHLLVEGGFLPFYKNRFLKLYLSLTSYSVGSLVAAESRISKQSGVQDVRQNSELCRCSNVRRPVGK